MKRKLEYVIKLDEQGLMDLEDCIMTKFFNCEDWVKNEKKRVRKKKRLQGKGIYSEEEHGLVFAESHLQQALTKLKCVTRVVKAFEQMKNGQTEDTEEIKIIQTYEFFLEDIKSNISYLEKGLKKLKATEDIQ
jgi:hypothetical protein